MSNISVIIPIYNAEKFIDRCIESVLNQTVHDYELVLVDDGSTDNSGKICDQYASLDSRIKVIHKTNGGPGSARNSGIDYAISESESEWITFVDADDWIHKQYLEKLRQTCMDCGTKIGICKFLEVENNDQVGTSHVRGGGYELVNPERIMCDYAEFSAFAHGKIYKKELFRNVRYPEKMLLSEDTATTYKVLFQCETIAILNMQLYYYFQNPNSLTHNGVDLKNRILALHALNEQIEFLKKNSYLRAYRKKEVLISLLVRTAAMKEIPSYVKQKMFHELRKYIKEFCKEFEVSRWYIYSKYVGFENCNISEKICYVTYKLKNYLKNKLHRR